MGLFANIMSEIFPAGHPAVAATAGSPAPAPAPGSATPATTTPTPAVDVEQILNGMAEKNPEKLNWRTSIVDLMKLVGIDSSLNARKTLAQELQYTGDPNDSASMNTWLHKQVMTKLAENGGKVPKELMT